MAIFRRRGTEPWLSNRDVELRASILSPVANVKEGLAVPDKKSISTLLLTIALTADQIFDHLVYMLSMVRTALCLAANRVEVLDPRPGIWF